VPAGLIAFDRFDGTRGVEGTHLGTFIAHADGSGERQLAVSAKVDAAVPVWSPDGTRLLLSAFILPDGPGRPVIVGADGTGFTLLEPKGLAGDLGCSDWAPDGKTLVCSVGSGAHPEVDGIYTLGSDGSHLTRLTTSPFHDTVGPAGECGGGESRGAYSPDGTKIAFIRQKCGTGPDPSSDESAAIELMVSDGSGLREIVPQGGVRSHPGSHISWSPDATQIVLGSQDGELFLVHPDGTGLNRISLPTDIGDHGAYGPSWSPDGKRIVFSMYLASADSTDLYTIAPDGSSLTRMTDGPGVEGFADWTDAPR
jgi:Tol biopolymer transport system component